MTLLGRQLAKVPLLDGVRKDANNARLVVLDCLFTFWAQRGCQGAFVADRAHGELVWKTRPGRYETLQTHWLPLLVTGVFRCGKRGNVGRGLDYQRPWRALQADMELLLDSWSNQVGPMPDPETVRARADMSGTGLKCLALRSMATAVRARVPNRLADQLFRLERWMGRWEGLTPGSVVLGEGLVREQMVAWERYLLQRAARGVRRRAPTKATKTEWLAETGQAEPGQRAAKTPAARRRKM
jgi:hypothetical protein